MANIGEERAATHPTAPAMNQIILAFLVGTALFVAINWIEPALRLSGATEGRAYGGMVSVLAWALLSLYLRRPLAVVVALGAWTGVVAVATSLAVGVAPYVLDGTSTRLVGPWSFLMWPAVGAVVCGATARGFDWQAKNGRQSRDAKFAFLIVVVLAGVMLAFCTSLVTSSFN